MNKSITPRGAVATSVELDIKGSPQEIFAFISRSDTLTAWLKKCGPVQGATGVEVLKGPYNAIGASRKVFFHDGSSIVETLLEFNPPEYYAYSITEITDVLRHFTKSGVGQFWFSVNAGYTKVTWTYAFVPKDFLSKIIVYLFVSLFYKKFLIQCLQNVKRIMEQERQELSLN